MYTYIVEESSCVFIETNGASAASNAAAIGRDAITAIAYFAIFILFLNQCFESDYTYNNTARPQAIIFNLSEFYSIICFIVFINNYLLTQRNYIPT